MAQMHFEKTVNSFERWKSQDASRASDVGEQREDIKQFLELTGFHKKAVSWLRALDKMEADKRDDVLRSFDELRREILEQHWNGQKTPDFFAAEPEKAEKPKKAKKPTFTQDFTPGDPEIQGEADAFQRQLDTVAAR